VSSQFRFRKLYLEEISVKKSIEESGQNREKLTFHLPPSSPSKCPHWLNSPSLLVRADTT